MDRFWSKVAPANERGCRLWTAGRVHGYGAFRLAGRDVGAHRVAYELAVGPIPPGLCVLHRCDVKACVEPSHLWLGTKAENNADRDAKGRRAPMPVCPPERRARGERNGAHTHPESRARGDRNGARLHPEKLARGERHGRHASRRG